MPFSQASVFVEELMMRNNANLNSRYVVWLLRETVCWHSHVYNSYS